MNQFASTNTISRLLQSKTIGFFGGLCLLFNAMTGPGIPYTPSLFSPLGSGSFLTIASFAFFSIVSGFSVLLIIETMQSIPGNKHFQGTVEFGTLINFYLGRYPHLFGQFLLYGALQSNAIQSIVISSQNTDNMLVDIFQKTCGLSFSGEWICVAIKSSENPSPFQCTPMVFTIGFLITLALVIPMGFVNLDDNIIVQRVSFTIALFIGLQWMSSGILSGLIPSRAPAFAPFSPGYGTTIGTVMLNLAFTTVVPSWINIKSKDVSAQKVVWSSILSGLAFYIFIGIFLAMGYDANSSGSVLPDLMTQGIPLLLSRITVYAYSFVMLVTSIPVSFIVTFNNLVQNQVVDRWTAIILSFIVPWFFSSPLLTGSAMPIFITWTSLLFVSSANFIVPVLIYYSCVDFRKKYNENRELTRHQRALLKIIHSSSKSIHHFIDNHPSTSDTPSIHSIHSNTSDEQESDIHITAPKPSIHVQGQETNLTLTLPNNPPSSSSNFLSPSIDTLKIRRNSSNMSRVSFQSSLYQDSNASERKLSAKVQEIIAHGDFDSQEQEWIRQDVPDPDLEEDANPKEQEWVHEISPTKVYARQKENLKQESCSTITQQDSFEGLGTIDPEIASQKSLSRQVRRFQTFPTHPDFISPTFRTIPRWLPVKTSTVASVLLYTTVFLSIANIIFTIYMSIKEPWYPCTPT